MNLNLTNIWNNKIIYLTTALDFSKEHWRLGIPIVIILFILIRTKIRGYFWKVRKTGEQLKFRQFLGRWRKGIEGITNLQIARTNLWGNRIMILGITLGIIINSVVRLKNEWYWIEIILWGSLILTIMQWVSFKQKFWKLREIDRVSKSLEADENKNLEQLNKLNSDYQKGKLNYEEYSAKYDYLQNLQ
jgi:hypothetical protein